MLKYVILRPERWHTCSWQFGNKPRNKFKHPWQWLTQIQRQRLKKMHAAHVPLMLIFHSCANFLFFFHAFYYIFLAFFLLQFWAFLLILHNFGHFLHIFCVLIFRLVWRVLFRKLFPSLYRDCSGSNFTIVTTNWIGRWRPIVHLGQHWGSIDLFWFRHYMYFWVYLGWIDLWDWIISNHLN